MVAALSFSVFTLMGGVMTVSTAFVSLLLFGLLQDPIARLPTALGRLASLFEC